MIGIFASEAANGCDVELIVPVGQQTGYIDLETSRFTVVYVRRGERECDVTVICLVGERGRMRCRRVRSLPADA